MQTKAVLEVAGMVNEPIAVIEKGKYIVSESGRVFTFRYNKKYYEQKKRLHSNGYERCCIWGKDVYVHRLVAKYFVDNPRNCKEVNHKDGNKKNNHASNLEWCTRSENNRHAFQTGLRNYEELKIMARKPKIKMRKYSYEFIRYIASIKGKSFSEIGRMFGMSHQTVADMCRRKGWYKEAWAN